ncbi:MBL fold metallo-hydrolase [Nocardioides sp. GCM10030258]|uniref:MBL fold metallo-hydrolase n=1 Tax=unclassified Nocardioides TaxID=2615069 RepID=UPI00361CCCA2
MSHGTFTLDGETWDVDNNIWVVGDDAECVVIDAPHSVEDIMAVVEGRRVKAILCTHGHDDHVRVAPALRARTGAPIMLHPHDEPVWRLTHPVQGWDIDLADGATIEIAGAVLEVLHTPGHAPGAVSFHLAQLGCVFTGDTLFRGGPGATGRSFSDRATLDESIRARLFSLAPDTVVHTGHGPDTTIAEERGIAAAARIRQLIGKRLPGEEAVP